MASIRSLKQAVETFEDHGDVSKKHVPFSGSDANHRLPAMERWGLAKAFE